MIALRIALWCVVLLALGAAIALAALSSRPGRHRLVLPAVGLVAVLLLWAILGGMSTVPHPIVLALAGLALAALAVIGGSPLVSLVLRLSTHDARMGVHGGIMVDRADEAPREILRGGKTIGYLERFAIVGCVAAGQLAGLALVVAIKGLGRYSELENAEARERFIIGTLVSFVWAVVCAAPIALALEVNLRG